MKEYNYLQAIYMSFYSKKLYRDIVQHWGAGTVLYLFLLLTLVWAILFIQVHPFMTSSFNKISTKYAEQLPVVEIKNGTIKTPESKPYFIYDPDTKNVVAIIDTSGKYQNFSNAPKDTKVIVTKETFLVYDDTKAQPIPSTINVTLKPDQVKESLSTFGSWFSWFFFPIAVIVSFLYRLVQALVYALLGLILGAFSKVKLSYSSTLKLALIAVTPSIVLSTFFDMAGIVFPFQWLLYFILSMGYLIFAMGANKN